MITLLSPSKKLNFNEQSIVHSHTECDFIQSAEILANEAKNLTEISYIIDFYILFKQYI